MRAVTRLGFLGGIYSNYLALSAALEVLERRGVDEIHALGDFGAFGPHPDRTVEILRARGLPAIAGNYETNLSSGGADCGCGYADPRDNEFAQISYDYTREHTAAEHVAWMATLPLERRLEIDGRTILLVHGSPRRQNEFLWESTSPDGFLEAMLAEYRADVLVCTHTGLHWTRRLPSGRLVVNCGALGRPANDGATHVWCARLSVGEHVEAELVPVVYDHERLAREMREERLPDEFVQTIRTGWWTTCLEELPARERRSGRH